MLTPAISDSRTSVPCIIIENAISMQVLSPPFLKMWPFPEAITVGCARFFVMIVGPCAGRVEGWPRAGTAAAAASPAVLVTTNSRREILSDMARLLRLRFADGLGDCRLRSPQGGGNSRHAKIHIHRHHPRRGAVGVR